VGAKADPTNTVIPVALSRQVQDHRLRERITIKHDGKHGQSVLYYDSTGPHPGAAGDVIVLGAFVFNNVRLPARLELGQPYDRWRTRARSAGTTPTRRAVRRDSWFSSRESIATWAPVRTLSRSTDFNADNFDHTGLGFIGGARSASARVAPARSRA